MFDTTPGWLQAARVQRHRWWRPLLWAGLLALSLMLAWQVATSHALLAADAIALSDSWRFVDESKPGAPVVTGELAIVATEDPTQVAARFNLSSTMQALALQLDDAELGGLPLNQIEELGYCTRLVDGPRPYAVTLQLNIDADVTDDDNSWQGRLVYTPSYNGAVIQGQWQCWNTLVGKWWATGGPVAAQATAENPQALATLLASFPHLGINAAYSVVALKAGDGWSSFQGEASPVLIGVEGERIAIAFGTASQDDPEQSAGNAVLLPILLNESPALEAKQQADDADKKGGDKKEKDKKSDTEKLKDDKKNRLDVVDWGEVNWNDIDWASFDWEKVDWEQIDWSALGWSGDEHAEIVRAFVDDVKQCKDRGWKEKGFNNARDCVATYIQEHTPAEFDWTNLTWGRNGNSSDHEDWRGVYSRHGRRGHNKND